MSLLALAKHSGRTGTANELNEKQLIVAVIFKTVFFILQQVVEETEYLSQSCNYNINS